MITVGEAQKIVLDCTPILGLEKVDLLSSLGRVIGENLTAPSHLPPWDHATMDGYAVRFDDITSASSSRPVTLQVIATLPAGHAPACPVGPLQAVRIMTGAPIPGGADTVVRKEDTVSLEGTVEILTPPYRGRNIRKAGENMKAGDLVIPKGTILGPPHIGILASFSQSYVSVYQRPRVAILSTGDEVTEIGSQPTPYRIVNSNLYNLAAQVKDCGARPLMLGIARDNREELRAKLTEGFHADAIITTGGVSMGDYDFVRSVLEEMGAEIKFWKVAMRPGKFTLFATFGEKLVFGLPGNPSSCTIAFDQFARPALLKMMGHTYIFRPEAIAVIGEDIKTAEGLRYYVRVRLRKKDGKLHATTKDEQVAGLIKSMVQADGLLVVPEDRKEVLAGEEMTVQILDRAFESGR